MISILIRSGFITILCIAASLAIVLATGGDMTGPGLWVPVVCCMVTAFPGSTFTLWQFRRLRLLNGALSQAHIELGKAHAKLAEKASRDAMTGFLNREAFFLNLDATRRVSDRGVLLIVDADHFKSINDRFGHQSGDDALMLISAAIRNAVREQDEIGRIGGEEFGVYLRGASIDDAKLIGERLRGEVEAVDFRPRDGQRAPLTVSIGGAICGTGASISELMREADQLLYQAKNSGRNRVVMPAVHDRIAA
jgi:diguanylate cyclase (GGDEF)-like protein